MHLRGAACHPLLRAPGPPRRVANRCAVFARPAWLAYLVLGFAGCAAAGCGGQASVVLPQNTSPPSAPGVVATDPPATARQQVIAAYTGYWQALAQALDTRNAGQARDILARYVAGSGIPVLISGFQADWERDEIQYGSPVLHILSVRIFRDHAAVHDCADFSNAGVQDARTGQVVGSLGNPHVNVISTLVLVHGRWLVSNQVPVVLSCAP
jgi:hypothetical protein